MVSALEISQNIASSHKKPAVRLVAGLHGNDIVGSEIILAMAEYFLSHSDLDDGIGQILDTFSLHLIPTVNLDGSMLAQELGNCNSQVGQLNSLGRDLENDFHQEPKQRQKETQ